jgi:hypothetical protein
VNCERGWSGFIQSQQQSGRDKTKLAGVVWIEPHLSVRLPAVFAIAGEMIE